MSIPKYEEIILPLLDLMKKASKIRKIYEYAS